MRETVRPGGKVQIRVFLNQGTHFYPMWRVREHGIAWLCEELCHAYQGTESVFDMDALTRWR